MQAEPSDTGASGAIAVLQTFPIDAVSTQGGAASRIRTCGDPAHYRSTEHGRQPGLIAGEWIGWFGIVFAGTQPSTCHKRRNTTGEFLGYCPYVIVVGRGKRMELGFPDAPSAYTPSKPNTWK